MEEIIKEKEEQNNIDKIDVKSLFPNELENLMEEMGEKRFRASQVFLWLHSDKKVYSFDEMTNISPKMKSFLKENAYITHLKEVDRLCSVDGTIKFLFELGDGQVIESVLMKYHHGNSVCISSQVGCRQGCRFCASTLGGLIRNLTASEMLEQIYEIERISGERVSNVVVMGTGEPMDNYDNLVRFVRLISNEKGKNMSVRNITVSTCGLVEGMKKLADEGLPITLALSLHAPNDEVRKTLLPVANKYKMEDVIAACDNYFAKTERRITYEYSLVRGVNDSKECAEELAEKLAGKNCHVNLIPVNPIKEKDYKKSTAENIEMFKKILEKKHINVTIRREMGSDINAACGQLRRSYQKAKEEKQEER